MWGRREIKKEKGQQINQAKPCGNGSKNPKQRTANKDGSKGESHQRGQKRMEREISRGRKALSKAEVQWRQKKKLK